MMIDKYNTAVTELYRIFNAIVEHHNLKSELSKIPVNITIQTKGRRPAYGWFFANSWKDSSSDKEQTYHEINISAEYLNRGSEAVAETMIHEVAHLVNYVRGIEDCNPVNQYHNKHFKIMAESLGLKVEKMAGKGYALTSLGEDATAFVNSLNINQEAFVIYRISAPKIQTESRYITINLDKEEFEDQIKSLCEQHGVNKPKDLIVKLLEMAGQE